MKKLVLLFVFLLSLTCWSETKFHAESTNPAPESFFQDVQVGASLTYYRYVEPDAISHNGIMIGAWADAKYEFLFYKAQTQASLMTGSLDYSGALCDINTNQCTDYKAKTNDLIFKVAHRFLIEFGHSFSLFAGGGYRYLFDKGDGQAFYRRTGQYFYLPLGATYRYLFLDAQAEMHFDFEYDYFLSGSMESKLSDVNRTWSDVKHQQNQGRAYKFLVNYNQVKNAESIRPYQVGLSYEFWSIEKSEKEELLVNGNHTSNYFYEPQNYSELIGLQVGWVY